MKQAFIKKRFKAETLELLGFANKIIAEYMKQGMRLTLRQLYYQFVARGLLENTVRNYKRLGDIVSDGRLAGLVDWSAIEDRTRSLRRNACWERPEEIVRACVNQYRTDRWRLQPHRVEVWIEKEALAGVFASTCAEMDVPFFACRGYVSQSEMYEAGKRLVGHCAARQEVVVLHFGDHDPSGIDMTRDIEERLTMFSGGPVRVERIALNMAQIEEYGPPPNPAKETDPRFEVYRETYGEESWELDALEPMQLRRLIEAHVLKYREEGLWEKAVEEEREHVARLEKAEAFLRGEG